MSTPDKLLLLVNLGSPKKPEAPEVGEFLDEFLMDPLVINIPKPLRWLLVKKLIVPKRSHESAEAYSAIWDKQTGSPLVHYTKKLVEHLSPYVDDFTVDYAMRYNGPSIESLIEKYKDYKEIYLLPVYPQYAESSTETVFVETQRVMANKPASYPKIKKVDYFFNQKEYIDALTKHIQKELVGKDIDHLLFSYHGLPENHIKKLGADYKKNCLKPGCCEKRFGTNHLCYKGQCVETTHLVSKELSVATSTSFQSRLGRAQWIKPYTTEHLDELVKVKGVKNLAVVCPSFVCDCLETLEEVDMQLREQFEEAGGKNFYYIPAFNTEEVWLKHLSQWFQRSQGQWPELIL